MGIDVHTFNFLLSQLDRGHSLGDVLTIGRQSLDVSDDYLKTVLPKANISSPPGEGRYCEPALISIGASSVESIDISDYEQPTYVSDLGEVSTISKTFDTIIDAGSLEHIFDVGNAFRNLIRLCKINGIILHALPVNNLNGHGFWQFSSDLMFSIYSEENGFTHTRVLYTTPYIKHWHEMPRPTPGVRVEIAGLSPVSLLCASRKIKSVDKIRVVQPYYLDIWKSASTVKDKRVLNQSTFNAANLQIRKHVRRLARVAGVLHFLRSVWLLVGLVFGFSAYSLKRYPKVNPRKRRVF